MEQKILIESNAYYDENNNIRFEPPVYLQRYAAVEQILKDGKWKNKIKKVSLHTLNLLFKTFKNTFVTGC